jgi:hypothetical protein
MKKLALLLAFLPTVALADPPSEYTLTVNMNDLNLLSKALSALPYGEVAPLFGKLDAQVKAQREPKEQQK